MFGSWGVQSSDPDLADKIAALKAGRLSPTDAVKDFLRQDLGVNVDELPMMYTDAVDVLDDWLWGGSEQGVTVTGSSLGLTRITRVSTQGIERITHGHELWPEAERIWVALRKEHPACNVFFYSATGLDARVKNPPYKTPTRYPTGTVLRIGKKSNPDITMYVRIGGLNDDTTPTELDNMQPVNTTGWNVIEVVEEP